MYKLNFYYVNPYMGWLEGTLKNPWMTLSLPALLAPSICVALANAPGVSLSELKMTSCFMNSSAFRPYILSKFSFYLLMNCSGPSCGHIWVSFIPMTHNSRLYSTLRQNFSTHLTTIYQISLLIST